MTFDIVLITLLTLIASIFSTITGFGVGTIMTSFLLFFFPFEYVLILVGVIHLFQSFWTAVIFRKYLNWRLILYFGIPAIFTSFLGAFLIFALSRNLMTMMIGFLLLLYSIMLLVNPSFKFQPTKKIAISGGLIDGFFAGLIGIRGALRSAFLITFNLAKFSYIGTSGAIAVMGDLTRVITYLFQGKFVQSNFLLISLASSIPIAFLGTKLGKYFVGKISQNIYRKIVIIFILLAGVRMLFL